PTRTSRDGLILCPLESTLPRSQARDARDRVLKNLAAQSHLSMRRPVIPIFLHRRLHCLVLELCWRLGLYETPMRSARDERRLAKKFCCGFRGVQPFSPIARAIRRAFCALRWPDEPSR